MQHAQLWKRILNEGLPPGDDNEDRLSQQIIKSPIIVDDRPLGTKPDGYDAMKSALLFPFDTFWMEGLSGCVAIEKSMDVRWGALVVARRSESGWVTSMLGVVGQPWNPLFLAGGYQFQTNAAGYVINDSRKKVLFRDNIESWGKEDAESMARSVFLLACDTLQLLACKNVALAPRDNDPKQVRRAVKRHGGTPDSYRYHVLVVRPAGAKSNAPAQEIGVMPRHVCRGHFAEYGPEFGKGLLFGQHAGRFFIPPHVKGDKKNGTVEKDYEIRPQPPEAANA